VRTNDSWIAGSAVLQMVVHHTVILEQYGKLFTANTVAVDRAGGISVAQPIAVL
jgi:hypothetical protein